MTTKPEKLDAGYQVTLPSLPLLASHPVRERARKLTILAGMTDADARQMGVVSMSKETASYTEQAWYSLTDEQQKSLAQAIYGATMKQAKDFVGIVKGMVQEHIETTVQSVLEFKKDEIREMIEKEVAARWQPAVEAAVKHLLEVAIAKVKLEMVK